MHIEDAIRSSQTGTQHVYWRGWLAKDRVAHQNDDAERKEKAQTATKAAGLAFRLYLDGQVHLLQRRRGIDNYEYIAVRADPALAVKRAKTRKENHGILPRRRRAP